MGLEYPAPVRGGVILLSSEDGIEDTIVPGLVAAGADLTKIDVMTGIRRGMNVRDMTLAAEDIAAQRRLEAAPQVRLVIIDPISSFVGTRRSTTTGRANSAPSSTRS